MQINPMLGKLTFFDITGLVGSCLVGVSALSAEAGSQLPQRLWCSSCANKSKTERANREPTRSLLLL
ncbi:Hypothetical predicted protein [Cloeon dipterum]|uniref:Uncharacterized protein n=1 Tax=Cloeon dipterum TaxID=197152 RepID=A0A8S1D8D4_9INSE|nr:Hypothetical predicted protein [Cloeon dipterum]